VSRNERQIAVDAKIIAFREMRPYEYTGSFAEMKIVGINFGVSTAVSRFGNVIHALLLLIAGKTERAAACAMRCMRVSVHVQMLKRCCRGDVEEFEVALILSRRGGDYSGYRLRVHWSGVPSSAAWRVPVSPDVPFNSRQSLQCEEECRYRVHSMKSNGAIGFNKIVFMKY
jgi:hypothetical protein